MLLQIPVLSERADIHAIKRALDTAGIKLVGYDVASDGRLSLRVEEESFEAAKHALARAGLRV